MRIFLTGVVEDGTTRREGVPIDPRASLSVTKGSNVEIVVAVVTPGGEPVKLTGVGTELLLTVKKRPTETATISRLAISEGNIGTFTLVPTDTRTQTAGLYGYDVWLTKDGKRDVVVPLSPFNLLEANAAIPADGALPPVPPSGNLVGGPGSSTDSAVALWDGGDGDLLKNSVIIVDGAGNVTTPGNISATQLQGNAVSAAAPSASDVLTWDGSAWAPAAGGGGVTDHGDLTGLTPDDDHDQYFLASGARPMAGDINIKNLNKITFDDDFNTYIWAAASDNQIRFHTDDILRLFLTNSDLVLFTVNFDTNSNFIRDGLGLLQLGGAMVSSHGLGVGDVGVDGALEVDGFLWADAGLSAATITSTGRVRVGSTLALEFGNNRSKIASPVDGRMNITRADGNTFFQLTLGPSTSNFPAFHPDGSGGVTLAAGDAPSTAMDLTVTGGIGFFAQTPPATRPAITGSRSGATVSVLTQLLTALGAAGIIDDQTTA